MLSVTNIILQTLFYLKEQYLEESFLFVTRNRSVPGNGDDAGNQLCGNIYQDCQISSDPFLSAQESHSAECKCLESGQQQQRPLPRWSGHGRYNERLCYFLGANK